MRAVVQNIRWGTAFPLLAFIGALAVAVIGAFITGNEIGAVTGGVESVSAGFGNRLGDWGDRFPFGFAFSAGMVSAVNPCGFAMLPAYLGLYLSESDDLDTGGRSFATRLRNAVLVGATVLVGLILLFTAIYTPDGFSLRGVWHDYGWIRLVMGVLLLATGPFAARLSRALLVGATVSVGFVVLFAAVGTPIGLGARGIADAFPWIGLIIGVLLVAAGAYLLSGGKLYNNFAASISSRFGNADSKSVRSYFTFGLAYGTASLSCTLPIFLAVIGGTFTTETFLDSLLQFVLYGLGMGSVILVLTINMAQFKGAMAGVLRKTLPHVGTISAVMMLVAGTFIVYYWLTLGELLERIRGA